MWFERFFRDITVNRQRRGVFTSVPELVTAIEEYGTHHNINPKPFIRTKSAADILEKVIRANSRLSSKQSATLHPPRQNRSRLNRNAVGGADEGSQWHDTDKHLKTERSQDCYLRRVLHWKM